MKQQFKLGSTSKKSTKKWLMLALAALLLALLVGGVYWFVIKKDATSSEDRNASDPTITTSKESDTNQDDLKTGSASASPSTTAQDVPVSTSLGVSELTFEQASGFVNASAVLSGAPQAGTCVFSFETADGRPVVKQASGTTSCSVKIAEVEFDKLGEWDLTVSFYNQDSKATASRKVAIQ